MKNNFKLINANIKHMLNAYRFKIIILFIICFNLFGCIYIAISKNYLDALFSTLSNPYYSLLLLSLTLVNTINTFNIFEKKDNYIIRFENREKYLKQLIINIFVSNTVLFVINLFVLLIFLNLFIGNYFVITSWHNYNIPNIIYLLFYITRIFTIIQIVSIINSLLFKLLNFKIVIILNGLIYGPFIFGNHINETIDSLLKIKILIHEYFLYNEYAGFLLEIIYSSIYIICLCGMATTLFHLTKNKTKSVGI